MPFEKISSKVAERNLFGTCMVKFASLKGVLSKSHLPEALVGFMCLLSCDTEMNTFRPELGSHFLVSDVGEAEPKEVILGI